MPSLQVNWPLGEGLNVSAPVIITNVNVNVLQQLLTVYLAPVDSKGVPVAGQSTMAEMPVEVFQAFGASQTIPMLQAILALPSSFWVDKGRPDLSKATLNP